MRVLITGGSGFIGSRLASELVAREHAITLFDKAPNAERGAQLVLGDTRDAAALSACAVGHDAIVHLAAEHRDDVRPEELYNEVNVGGTKNVVEAAEAANISRIVFTSTVSVYPLGSGNLDENHPTEPINRYGESKLRAEAVLRQWVARAPDRSLVVVRSSVVFGERNRGNVYNLLSQIQRGRFLMVGDGRNLKSIAYVGNLVKFLANALAFCPGDHLYNYADKPDLSVRELVSTAMREFGMGPIPRFRVPYAFGLAAGYGFDALASITGRSFPITSMRIRKFCADTTISVDRMARTGFKGPFELGDALRRTIRAEFPLSRPPLEPR